ncbi:MAG: response regulator [Rubrobacter sp.]|nr:response regulator [Rubrobacter sp.]
MGSERIILLVEDDENQEILALHAFRKHGIMGEVDEIAVARNGEEALDFLFGEGEYSHRDASVLPEFVLLDLDIPKIDGVEVLEKLRADARTELLPVVIFSSSDDKKDLLEGYRAGANSYITKPANFARFSEAMKQMGWYWLDWNETPPVEEVVED